MAGEVANGDVASILDTCSNNRLAKISGELNTIRAFASNASPQYDTMATTRTRSPSGFPDPTPINLNRLLSRLEHNVLVEPSPQLRKSPYERARVSAVSFAPYSPECQLGH